MSEKKELSALEQEINKSFHKVEEGALIEGVVVQIDSEYAYLDVNLKSEGKISLKEFTTLPSIGDKVSGILKNKDGKNGDILISKKQADQKIILNKLKDAFKNKTVLEGKISKVVKGGFDVMLSGGIVGFLPHSKADVHKIENDNDLLGLESNFLVFKLEEEKGRLNIVLSRKELIIDLNNKAKDEFFDKTNVGDEVEGVVKSFTSFGAFVDLGGFDGLLHLNDMSWGYVSRPKDYVKKDQKIKLKVINIDRETNHINLSLKHFAQDPWVGFQDRYKVDSIVKGKVTKLADFGAFVELEDGIEGLVHISELSWTKRIKHPKEVLAIGDAVEVAILGYDTESERISLGLKQALSNPWTNIENDFPVDKLVSGSVKKVTNVGMFVELDGADIEAFLHFDDLSWNKKGKENLKVGDKVEAKVLYVSSEENRLKIGVKQLSENPWESLKISFKNGDVQTGKISNKTEFGLFLELPNGIEGLLHKSQLTETKEQNPDELMEKFNIGDEMKVVIVDLDEHKKRLALSVREMKSRAERSDMKEYLDSDKESSGASLGDFLKK